MALEDGCNGGQRKEEGTPLACPSPSFCGTHTREEDTATAKEDNSNGQQQRTTATEDNGRRRERRWRVLRPRFAERTRGGRTRQRQKRTTATTREDNSSCMREQQQRHEKTAATDNSGRRRERRWRVLRPRFAERTRGRRTWQRQKRTTAMGNSNGGQRKEEIN